MSEWKKSVRRISLGLFAAFCLVSFNGSARAETFEQRLIQCKTCHGDDGNAQVEKTPSLAGQPEFFILNQLVLMREGVRKVEAMAEFVKGLKDDEIQKLATYFALQKPKTTPEKIDPALVKRGAAVSEKLRCASCHGDQLQGETQIPRIAGQRIDYMFDVMKAFRDNKREGADTNMTAAVYGTSDADLEALAHYAASR